MVWNVEEIIEIIKYKQICSLRDERCFGSVTYALGIERACYTINNTYLLKDLDVKPREVKSDLEEEIKEPF